jgi:hypothetical protein
MTQHLIKIDANLINDRPGEMADDLHPPEILTSVLSRYSTTRVPEDRPFVTLTYAQSLDAKIAGQHGKQLILSGKESMVMTHWLVNLLLRY